jgi:hypothetical protein
MSSRVVTTVVIMVTFCSCVTAPKEGYTALPNTREFDAGYDRVWGAVVSIMSEKGAIKNVDKASGLITTEPFSIGSGFLTQNALQQYAYQPPNLLGTWGAAQGSLNVLVSRKGDKTVVRATARFAGFENNVSHAWMQWPTKGVLENQFLKDVAATLGSE